MADRKTLKKLLMIFLFITSFDFLFAEKILFSANSMTGKSGDSNTTTKLVGNAYIRTDTMEIKADKIELSGEDYRYISAIGNVNGTNTESHMEFICGSLKYDRITKVATLEENVKLTDTDNDVKADAQIIEYDQEKDIAVLQIKITLTQKDNICSGAYAVYHKKQQLLELTGNAQIKQKEDLFRAQYITLDMDTQDITLGGNVKGTVKDSKASKSDFAAVDESKSEENLDSDSDKKELDEDQSENKNSDEVENTEDKEKLENSSKDAVEKISETDTSSKTNQNEKTQDNAKVKASGNSKKQKSK